MFAARRPGPVFCSAYRVLLLSQVRTDEYVEAERLVSRLKSRPCPVLIGNPDLVAPREDGLSIAPGFFGHDILDRTNCGVHFSANPSATFSIWPWSGSPSGTAQSTAVA